MTPALARRLARLLGVRVTAGAKLDRERRADELERVAEIAFQVALVGGRHAIERVAVDDDARRVDAALVGVAQLRPDEPGPRRRLALHRGNHGAGELRRRKARHRRGMRRVDRAHQAGESLRRLGGNEMRFGEAEEAELPLQLALHAAARFLVAASRLFTVSTTPRARSRT